MGVFRCFLSRTKIFPSKSRLFKYREKRKHHSVFGPSLIIIGSGHSTVDGSGSELDWDHWCSERILLISPTFSNLQSQSALNPKNGLKTQFWGEFRETTKCHIRNISLLHFEFGLIFNVFFYDLVAFNVPSSKDIVSSD